MTRSEAAHEIINQSPAWAQAYLWTFIAFLVLCLILGYFDHRRNK